MKQGESTKASLEHLVFYPMTKAARFPTIVALHGRGADEYDLPPLLEALALKSELIISARAPLQFSSGGYAWYEPTEEGVPHQETFQSSLFLLRRFLSEIKTAYPVDLGQLLLLGFSQGTVMAYAAGLLEPASFRGIAALSGYVPQRSGLVFRLEQVKELSFFISHGKFDELIPIDLGRESAKFLKAAGAAVEFHEYAMGHEVREETLRDLGVWLRKLTPTP